MGQPKFPRKQYDTPLHPWKEERIQQERELIKKYGLKNHKEVWKAKTFLGKYRQQARELLARIGTTDPQIKRESDQLLVHLTKLGILPVGATLDDVLALEIESVIARRLQTLVYLKGFASTATQSRQLINHGHIRIGERKVTIPGFIVTKDEEEFIGYTEASPLNEVSHPARPKTDMIHFEQTGAPPTQEEEATKSTQPSRKEKTQKPEQRTPSPKPKTSDDTKKPTKEPPADQESPAKTTEEKKPEKIEKSKADKPSEEQKSTPETITKADEPSKESESAPKQGNKEEEKPIKKNEEKVE